MNTVPTQASVDLGKRCRSDFPLLRDSARVYLDTAASAQKPELVLKALDDFYRCEYANIHRGVYDLSVKATERYEEARVRVANFIGASRAEEVVITSGTTESVNLVAHSWGQKNISEGDEILVSLLEHHSNFVPWQRLAESTGAELKFIDVCDNGTLDLEDFSEKLNSKTKLLAITQLSNALGVAPPLDKIIPQAAALGVRVFVDGAQGITHGEVDVVELGADFYAFSGHKLYGPSGVGFLYAKYDLLSEMPPFMSGGDMIYHVSTAGTEYAEVPTRFEAGTPHIAGAIAMSAAIDYVEGIGLKNIVEHERIMVELLEAELARIPEVEILGPIGEHRGLVSFNVAGLHPHDVSQFVSSKEVLVRAGHHCAQPLLERLGVFVSTRASVGVYTTESDIKALIKALKEAIVFFTRT